MSQLHGQALNGSLGAKQAKQKGHRTVDSLIDFHHLLISFQLAAVLTTTLESLVAFQLT